jgi:uncharacterized protein YggE
MKKKFVWILLSIVGVLVLGACSGTSSQAVNTPQPPQRVITVTGSGQVYLTPDVAYVNVGVHSVADTVGDALKLNTSQATAVASSLKELGVDAKDIQTNSFNVYPQQQFGPQGEVIKTTYAVDNSVFVTVRDLSKLGQILDVVVQNGANAINGITFDVLDKSKALTQVRQMAVTDARMQAQQLADAAGVKLGNLRSLNVYESGNTPVPAFAGKGGAPNAAAVAAPVPVSAGQMMLSLDANLVYEIK